MSSQHPKHIFIIDDDETTTFMVSEILRKKYRTSVAHKMEDGLFLLKTSDVDIAIVDIFMPGMGGLEGIKKIRKLRPDIKILAISAGYSDELSPAQALAAAETVGADKILSKPIEHDVLLNTIENIFADKKKIEEKSIKIFNSQKIEEKETYKPISYDDRSKFLLRILYSKVYELFRIDEKNSSLPNSIIYGFEEYLNRRFGEVVYEDLNMSAEKVLRKYRNVDGSALWDKLVQNHEDYIFLVKVLVRFMICFESFQKSKGNFLIIVNKFSTSTELSEADFFTIFEALFGFLFEIVEDENECLKLDFLLGDGTSAKIVSIENSFYENRKIFEDSNKIMME